MQATWTAPVVGGGTSCHGQAGTALGGGGSSHLYGDQFQDGTIMHGQPGRHRRDHARHARWARSGGVDSSHLYWTTGQSTVDKANMDGNGVTTIVNGKNGAVWPVSP